MSGGGPSASHLLAPMLDPGFLHSEASLGIQ